MIGTGDSDFEDVPPVDPEYLRPVFVMVYVWAQGGDGIEGAKTMGSGDLRELLDRIARACDVEPPIATALFKRALALSTFCAEAELSDTLFDNGLPGGELCTAAAKAPVLSDPGETDDETTHCFDEATMHAALIEPNWPLRHVLSLSCTPEPSTSVSCASAPDTKTLSSAPIQGYRENVD